jgi:hypothetical protein
LRRYRTWHKFHAARTDIVTGVTAGVLRLGIAQGGYVAYIEVSDSGKRFQYRITRNGVRLLGGGDAPDFTSAKQKAEQELRSLCSAAKPESDVASSSW